MITHAYGNRIGVRYLTSMLKVDTLQVMVQLVEVIAGLLLASSCVLQAVYGADHVYYPTNDKGYLYQGTSRYITWSWGE